MAPFKEILSCDELGQDRFRFAAVPSELPRTFGGQVVAQALMAAARTVAAEYPVHSVHGYFLAPGRPDEPSEHQVIRIRDGGSFRVRQVNVVQADRPIFTMTASFHRGDEGFSHQIGMPQELTPDEIAELDLVSGRTMRRLPDWHDWEMRLAPRPADAAPVPAVQRLWIRHVPPLPDDPVQHACALAYLSDMAMLRAARLPHPRRAIQGASLDHAIWFLRPVRVDQWLLYDQASPSAELGRALTQGRLFDARGALVAVTTQEGVFRIDRTAPADIPQRK
ncbi:MAG TPA: acyl-CoA thioesterase II [Actinophytocola sp.]|uniref:acyl-CoA thioesterase n=1 Tax=Actinophytocola sp. TaxID=1872138 RepID=UPI002DBAC16B|nr:acyl-CoA thioesterase II [Actinophytocola sp.]HEU5470462.1 acyl-CoA thioesterase II [Actinophytocola sp.]